VSKTLKLWFSSKECGQILSGVEVVTDEVLKDIKRKSGFTITRCDIAAFPKLLESFPSYNGLLYRGVCSDDRLYQQVLAGQSQVETTHYYSCSKSRRYAQSFSTRDRILLVIRCSHNFDVSQLSPEREVILDRHVILSVDDIVYEDNSSDSLMLDVVDNGFTVVHLRCTL